MYARLYFSRNDFAYSSKSRNNCSPDSRVGVVGVGEKLRPLARRSISVAERVSDERLCTYMVMSGSLGRGACLKNENWVLGGMKIVCVEGW